MVNPKAEWKNALVVVTDPDKVKLRVVYTNIKCNVEYHLNILDRVLSKRDTKIVGFNLDYTKPVNDVQEVTLAQLCIDDMVLLYHYCNADEPCPRFANFIANSSYSFATVDASNDSKVLCQSGLSYPSLVNIQAHYKIIDNGKTNDSLVDLAKDIIDPISYADVKPKEADPGGFHSY